MRLVVSLVSVVLLASTACSSGSGSADEGSSPTVSFPEEMAFVDQKPTPSIPDGPAPSEIVSQDAVIGEGAEAVDGKTVTVQYVGVRYKDGVQFDASWDRTGSFSFLLGSGQVISGWDEGVKGMKVGGRRQLILPPEYAYGETGAGADIGPGETLVFVVDLLNVE